MLEAQSNTSLSLDDHVDVECPSKDEGFRRKKLSELKIPFIYFFQTSVKFGVFKDLGDLDRMKEKCSAYRGYIDRWVAKAIKNKEITILKDGKITPTKGEVNSFEFYDEAEGYEVLENISKKITEVAVNDLKMKEKRKGISSSNFYAIKNHPELTLDYKNILNKFLTDMNQLIKRSAELENTDDVVHCVGLSSCSINEEVLSDI